MLCAVDGLKLREVDEHMDAVAPWGLLVIWRLHGWRMICVVTRRVVHGWVTMWSAISRSNGLSRSTLLLARRRGFEV
jgi:hypothetical protein